MKGAIAEPLVSTKRPPNTIIMIRIGSNQYFLRTRKNIQNSFKNEAIVESSELLGHGFGGRTGRVAYQPVTVDIGIGLQPKRAEVILAGACVVRTVLARLGCDSLSVSDRGLRHGLLADRFGDTPVT